MQPLSIAKSFGESACKLCMQERISILKCHRKKPWNFINKSSEIYGSCRHKPRFHRFTLSTDEASLAERVNSFSPLSELSFGSNQDLTALTENLLEDLSPCHSVTSSKDLNFFSLKINVH